MIISKDNYSNLNFNDLLKIDSKGNHFNYWFVSEICDYLFNDILSGKCYFSNWVGACSLLNKDFKKFYMSIFAKVRCHIFVGQGACQTGAYTTKCLLHMVHRVGVANKVCSAI